jgi:nudix-type nucleoside diphosphatase (YffH/AdpP family)
MGTQLTRVDTVHEGWGKYLVATIQLPDGRTIRREIEDHGRAVCVLPYDPRRKTAILVCQFRAPVFLSTQEEATLEAIAGILEEADPMDAARREAMEEAGLKLGALEYVLTGWTMPGVSTERMDFYFASYNERDKITRREVLSEDSENIVVAEMNLDDLAMMADAGLLSDVKAFLLIQTLRLRRRELFR